MNKIEQIVAYFPYGEIVLYTVEEIYDFSKDKTLRIFQSTKGKIVQTRDNYVQFRANLEKTMQNIAQETANEVMTRIQNFAGVSSSTRSTEQTGRLRARVQQLFQIIIREYVLRNRIVNSKGVQSLIKLGKKYQVEYIVPMYINLRAVLIVTKEMLVQFIENSLNGVKLTYESSKDSVVMFIKGNFSQDRLKTKIFQGIDQLRRLTVKVANTGLQVRVDRQFLFENYDKFAVNFLQVVKQLREKGEGNVVQIKNKSKNLYQQVIKRIRQKQVQMKRQLNWTSPGLVSQLKSE